MSGNPEVEITNLEYDSRKIRPDGLFLAIKGFMRDGYDFVDEAVRNGAVAVMGERQDHPGVENHVAVPDVRKAMATVAAKFYGYPGRKLDTCGVTGTNGKTTTCFLLKSIFEASENATGMITSQVYDTGGSLLPADRTTPESLDLQRLLFEMVRNGCVRAVIEVSSHALMLRRVEHVDFRVAVYTNLTRDHLDFHQTMEEYLRAKAILAERVSQRQGRVAVNLDVDEFRALVVTGGGSPVTYSVGNKAADVFCDTADIRPEGTALKLVTPFGSATVRLRLAGRFNLANAVAAAAGAIASEVDLKAIVRGLESATPVPGRFNYVSAGQPFTVYIDYAHTPDAIERLCQSAREVSSGRLLLLFGCGGDRDRGKRPLMGKAASTFADYALVTSDNPRSEDPADIIEDIKPGLVGGSFEICPDRTEAINKILKMARPDDVVLLAGKGDENYQETAGVKHHFSDAEETLKALQQLGYANSRTQREN
jgi:UDP-N-acetylmuramoyl-L-alanyl-D-glutamate--2,6-diaminopimelate ligase